jgi:peptidoglycan/LPS O-acetylase OafA/YrhL
MTPPGMRQHSAAGATKAGRRHQLDGLRGVAIILVVALHSVAEFGQRVFNRAHLQYVGDGFVATLYSGLELFFVLSGVVILAPYLRGTKVFRARSYLTRRARRLWPPYLVALLFGGIVIFTARAHLTWYSAQQLPRFSVGRWAAQLAIVNFGWTAFNGAWWSLTLEVVFYVLVPVLLIVLARTWTPRGSKALLAAVAVAAAASLFFAVTPARIDPGGLVQLGFAFLPCFALGMAVARFDPSARTGAILVAIGVAGVLIALADKSLNVHAPFGLLWAGVVVVATNGSSPLRAWLAGRHLVWLGERSYSLFLVHFSVFYLIDYLLSLREPGRTALFDLLSRAIGLPLALLAAMTLFWVVERRQARGLVTADAFWPWQIRPLASAGEPAAPAMPDARAPCSSLPPSPEPAAMAPRRRPPKAAPDPVDPDEGR